MDILGASSGLSESVSSTLKNDFNTIANNDIDNSLPGNRVEPRQVATGVTRGTWRINNTDGSYITIGLIPGTTDFGIAFFDSSNNLMSKYLGGSQTIYDSDNNELVNIDGTGYLFSFNSERRMKLGLKPDSSDVGAYITPAGTDVIDELNV
jgi:hypothetical protein